MATTFSRFKNNTYYEWVVDKASVELTKQGHKKLATDPRSYKDSEGYWHVFPIAFSEHEVAIICPYCMHVHFHGFGNGGRCPHCVPMSLGKKDYILEGTEQLA